MEEKTLTPRELIKISLKPEMIIQESGEGDAKQLLSEDGHWFPGWDSYPAAAYIDLGKEHTLEMISFNDIEGKGDFKFQIGEPNGKWDTVWEGTTDKNEKQEKDIQADTRYVRIVLEEAGAKMNSLQLFGESVPMKVEDYILEIIEGGVITHSIPVSEDVSFCFKKQRVEVGSSIPRHVGKAFSTQVAYVVHKSIVGGRTKVECRQFKLFCFAIVCAPHPTSPQNLQDCKISGRGEFPNSRLCVRFSSLFYQRA